ncbi:cupin domain-containing protein [Sporomusa carbonis]|uniref:cupin domain-containing protein n=1 Tax=Sporomusa carbonis TaxID=3076075 RepID=UPI003C7BA6F2
MHILPSIPSVNTGGFYSPLRVFTSITSLPLRLYIESIKDLQRARFLLSPLLPFSLIEFEYCVIPAGGSTGPVPAHQPPLKEYLVVSAGKIALCIGPNEQYVLEDGDSISCEVSIQHELVNIGNQDAHFYYISEKKSQ